MSFRDFLRKLIPIGRKEAREQYRRLNQKLEELRKVLQRQREQSEELLQVVQSGQGAADERFEEISKSSKQLIAMQTEEIAQINQKMQAVISGDIFRRIEFLQSRLVRMEYLIQSNLLDVEEQKSSLTYQFILRMRALFPLMAVNSPKKFVRMGRPHDGGYVMLDDFENRKIAYSFGIADDVTWDADIADRGLDVYMYDHTISGLPSDNKRFHFSPVGLSGESAQTENLKSLSELMRQNGHSEEYGMILKIDIEGAEWDVLCGIDEDVLRHFSQIVFEFHELIYPGNEEKVQAAMNKLNRTHQLVHIHANNFGNYLQSGGAILPELIEGTYLLRDEYTFTDKTASVRWDIDSANNPILPEIDLGVWNT